MNLIKNRSEKIDPGRIVIFGAGRIGRSFIGQLFGCNGYEVVFVDIDPVLISHLNSKRAYRVVIKGDKESEIIVPVAGAINASERELVSEAVSEAGILSVSVGKDILGNVIPLIAEGLKTRYFDHPDNPLDIILAENMRSAGIFVKKKLLSLLPAGFPVDSYVGLIETSIGKMVPIMPASEIKHDPLLIYAEPYNTLILDGKAFKNRIPGIKDLAPKNNIKAWVDRKAFIHNLGHATAAYFGHRLHPDSVYLYEVLSNPDVFRFTRETMQQSGDILIATYPYDFTPSDIEDHIDDLLKRFRNKALKDTVFRVGKDLSRKLYYDDRFMSPVRMAIRLGKPYDKILMAMSCGLYFKAKDEKGGYCAQDIELLERLSEDFTNTLATRLGFNIDHDKSVINELESHYRKMY